MPAFSSIELLAVRSDLIEEAGLPYPKTFADVIKVGRALHAPRRGRYGIAWNAQRGMPLASSFAFHIACCGGAVLQMPRGRSDWSIGDIDRREIVVGMDSEAGRHALDHMRELLTISPPGVLDLDWNSSLEIFMTGKAAMAHCWSMRATRLEYDVRSRVKRRVRYLPEPAGPKGSNVTPLGGIRARGALQPARAARRGGLRGDPLDDLSRSDRDAHQDRLSRVAAILDERRSRDRRRIADRPRRQRTRATRPPADLAARPLPQYTRIEAVIGEEIHAALRGENARGRVARRAGGDRSDPEGRRAGDGARRVTKPRTAPGGMAFASRGRMTTAPPDRSPAPRREIPRCGS